MEHSKIADRIREQWQQLTKSDRLVARRLLTDYPVAGLKTLAELAGRAGVSAPSVIRCVKKLGFDSYPDFQRVLHEEVQQSFENGVYNADDASASDQIDGSELESAFTQSIRKTVQLAQNAEVRQLAAAIASTKSSVLCLGGRVSQALAMVFQAHLARLRRNVELVSTNPVVRAERLMDVGKNDVVVVFDFGQYDPQARSFAQLVNERKAMVVCFTDFNQSPAAESAQFVICADNRTINGALSLTAALCAAEIVLDEVRNTIGHRARSRRRNPVGTPDVSFELRLDSKNA